VRVELLQEIGAMRETPAQRPFVGVDPVAAQARFGLLEKARAAGVIGILAGEMLAAGSSIEEGVERRGHSMSWLRRCGGDQGDQQPDRGSPA
jgi:hypothetical protein